MANSQSGLAAHGDERGTNYNKHCSCRVKFTIPCTHARAEKKNYLENVFLLKAVGCSTIPPYAMKNNKKKVTPHLSYEYYTKKGRQTGSPNNAIGANKTNSGRDKDLLRRSRSLRVAANKSCQTIIRLTQSAKRRTSK